MSRACPPDKRWRERDRRRQIAALAVSCAINVGLIVVLETPMTGSSPAVPSEGAADAVEATLVGPPAPASASSPGKAPNPAPPPAITTDAAPPMDDLAPRPDPAPAGTGEAPPLPPADQAVLADFMPSSGGNDPDRPCDLAGALATDLGADPAARLALGRLPPESRSVANAVMMWDGDWPSDTRQGPKALLRAMIQREIAAARPACRDEANTGPRLFLASGAGGAVAVALGSGDWRWSDLLR
jgi:hypothetical protein